MVSRKRLGRSIVMQSGRCRVTLTTGRYAPESGCMRSRGALLRCSLWQPECLRYSATVLTAKWQRAPGECVRDQEQHARRDRTCSSRCEHIQRIFERVSMSQHASARVGSIISENKANAGDERRLCLFQVLEKCGYAAPATQKQVTPSDLQTQPLLDLSDQLDAC